MDLISDNKSTGGSLGFRSHRSETTNQLKCIRVLSRAKAQLSIDIDRLSGGFYRLDCRSVNEALYDILHICQNDNHTVR